MIGMIFGRFNPPTIGHQHMIDKALKEVGSDKLYVFISKTQDKKKNPLNVDEKEIILSSMYKGNSKVVFFKCDNKVRTIFEALKYLNVDHSEIKIFCGQDRFNEYDKLIKKYNDKDYIYDKLEIKSLGDRDPDSDGITGMSASKLRNFAINNDYDNFKKGMSNKLSDNIIKKTFDTIQTVLK